ncbi:MAG: fibronectin type III domain-containing protein [Bacteroidales bacterium]|nr:fibronectin type III domain-containing protein [Bacteroidales bacterium]
MKKLLFFLMTLMALSLSWGGAVKAQETHTVYEDETATSNNAPIRSGSGSQTEFVYPASLLANMEGGTITSVKFFLSSVYSNSYAGTTITVYMQEVEGTLESVSAWQYNQNTATKVYEGTTLSVTNSELVITFSTPYEYNGGNLCFNIWSSSTAPTNYFYGKSTDYVSCVYDYSITPPVSKPWSSGSASFLPKAEFTYTPAATGSCEKPSALEAPNVTATSATLTWTGGSGTYNLEVKGGSYTDWTSVLSNTSLTTTTLTPLDPETQYQIRVQSVCGEEVSGWKTSSFTTPCGILSTFPKTYTFETSDGFPSNASTPTTNQLGNCWRNEATVQNGSYSTRVWGTSTSYKKNGSQSLVLPDKGSGSKTMLVFPAMDFTSANGYVVSFWIYRSTTGSSSPEGFKVYASDCDTIGANAMYLGHYSRYYNIDYPQTESTSGWYYYETAPITITGTVYIIFEGQSYYISATYVDDITIKVAPNCLKPTGLEANNVTTHSADLSWTANSGETAWTIYYKKTSDENYTEVSNVTENPYTLPSLDHSSNYQFYVVANCSATDNSEASDVKTFSTECAAISADGYSANFDDYTAGNNVLPLCWRPINTTTNSSYTGYPKIYNYNANSPSNCLYLYSYAYYSGGITTYDPQPQYAILPEMTDLAGKQITLQARGNNTSSTFKVGTMSDPTDASTFTEITSSPDNPAAITTSYQEYIFYIPSNTTDRYVAIMIEAANSSRTTNGVYIDDIVFSVAPTCWRTQNLAASNVTNESATLTWQRHAMGEETAWVLQYGTDENFGDGTYTEVTPSTNPTYTIENGLAATTTYYVRVKPACDNDGNLWSDTISFETEASCMIPNNLVISDVAAHEASLNWNGNNDSYTLRYRKALTAPVNIDETYDFEDGTLQGWTTISNDNDNNPWSIASGSSYAHSSYYCARSRYTSSGDGIPNDWLISPEIPLGGTLSFYAKRHSTSYTDQFQVFISTTGNNISDFTAISEVITPNTTYDLYEYDLSAYSGNGYVAIVYTGLENQYYVYVDDIHITASIPGVYDEWQTVNNATKPYPFSDLDAETYYEAQVNGYCNSSSTTTDWSDPISFTTAIACPAPTNLAYSNVAAHTVDLTWNVNGNPTTNYVLTKDNEESNIVVTINEGVATYQLQNLNGETEYTVSVHANCGTEDGFSLESNEVTFTTQVSCAIPTGLDAIDETTSSIKLHWTANNGETAWVVAHKIDGSDDFTEVTVAQADLDGDGNYNLTGLSDGKTYTIKVRANCGVTDQSQWSSTITHATAASCATPTDLTVSDVNGHGATISWTDAPVEGKNYIVMVASENMALNVDFENNSIPSNFTNDANYPWYVYSGTESNSKAMRSSNNGVNSSTSAIEVTVNVTEASTLSFDFWSLGEGTSTYWDKSIFYIDNVQQFERGETSTWESYNAPIAVGSHTLKWEYTKDNTTHKTGDCFYVDNIKITAGASAFVEKSPTTATSLVLDDLDPETTYYVKVKGDCGSATSPESGVETFTTPAACNAPTSLTYDDESVTAHTVDLSWTENNGATAWKVIYSKVNIDNSEITVDINENNVITDGTTITYTLGGLDGQTDYIARVKSNCGGIHNDISAESNSTSFTTLTACYPVGDVITSDITAYTVTVHWSDYYNAGAYIVKQGDNVLDGTTTPSVVIDATNHTATISGLEPEHTYTYGTFTVFADCGTEGMSTGTKVPYFQTEPSCHPVTNVNITGKTPNSVTFTWEDTHTPGAYIIKEGENVLTDVTAHSVVIDATNLTATISGLDENETYSAGTFKVFADCGTTDGQSAGVNVPAFTTPCSAHNTFPWTENFNDLTTANTIPDCWNNDEGTTSTESYKWCYTTTTGNGGCNGTSHDGSKCVRFNSYYGSHINYLKSIPLSLPTDQTMQLKFWYKNPTGGDFSVYISTDGGATHETALATGLTGVSDWTEHDPINLSAYVGQEVVIVFKGTSNAGNGNAYIYLDDVTVEEAPACAPPTALGATAISNYSATLSWTANSGETDWTLYYKKTSEENYTVVTENVTNPYALAVDPATEYIYYVVANCSATTTSDPSSTYTFTTKCNPFVVHRNQSFTENFDATTFPPTSCWNTIPSGTYDWSRDGTSGKNHSGSIYGSAYSYYYGDVYLVLPDIALTDDATDVKLTFWSYNTYVGSYGKNSVVLLDGDNETELWSPTSVSQSWKCDTVNLSAYKGQTISLAFKYEGSNAHGWYLDDIAVAFDPCYPVTNLSYDNESLTANTVALSWTPGAETNWRLQYRENGTQDWNTVDVAETDLINGVYTLDQLNAGATYEWQVAAACTNTFISDYTAGANFTTLENCPAPTNLTLTTDSETPNGATITWTAGSTANEHFTVEYRVVNEESWIEIPSYIEETTYTFTTLEPATTYQARVSAVCGTYLSDYSDVVEFTTEAIPEFTVTFVAGNSGTCSTTELTGGTVELPVATPLQDCLDNGWTFAGWTTTELTENTTTAPAPLYEAGTSYTPSASILMYAVYMRTEGEALPASYNLVTEEPSDWSGDYLIVYTNGNAAFNSSQADLDANSGNVINISNFLNNNSIASNATTDAVKVTIAATGNGNYSLLAANGKYFGNTSNDNKLVSSTSSIDNTISLDASGNADIESSNTHLRFNTQSASGRFRYFKSTSYTSQQPIQLYRYTSATPVTYAGAPDCSVPVSYNIIVTQVQGATITAPSTAAAGDEVQLSIVPEDGYALNEWQVTTSTGPVTVTNNSFVMPAANVNVTATLFNVYTVAATAVPTEGGTITGAGSFNENTEVTLTANANTGYDFTGWYNGDDQVSENTSYTFTVTGNVTLEARFAPRHTVTFNAGNGSCATTSLEGSTIDLSNVVALPSDLCANQGWTFAGWSETSVDDETTSAPTLVNTIYTPASDINLYAVYSKTDAGAGQDTWTMATSIAVGDVVVMVYEGNVKKELTGVNSNIGTATDYTVLPAGTYPLTVEQGNTDNTYAFKNNSNYLALTGNNNNLYTLTEKDNRSSWTVTSVSDGFDIKNVSYDTRYLQYNTSSPRFACYTHTQQPVRFYKLIPGDVTTYNSNPACVVLYHVYTSNNTSANGSFTIDPSQAAEGTTITLTPTVNAHYHLTGWSFEDAQGGSVDVTVTDNTFAMPAFDVYVAMLTAPDQYTIAATADPAAGGTVNGAGTYDYGTEITLTATANAGYTFVNWTKGGELVSLTPTCTLTVTEAATYVANFSVNSYNITANVAPANSGSVEGAGSYTYGSTATLTATAATGYHFVNWTKDDVEVSPNATYSFTVAEAGAYVAHFQINNYDITVSANPTEGGTVSGAGNYNYESTAILTAIANEGYTFVNWTKGGESVSTNATCTLTVTEAAAYVANFELNSYEITATANPTEGGTVNGAGTYDYGTEITLTATANAGYTFVNWTKGGEPVSTNPTCTLTVTEAAAYVANFSLNSYAVTATVNPAEGGTVTGAGTYFHGDNVTLTATANNGYHFVNWTENDAEVSTDASYSFTFTGARNLVANFAITPAGLSWSAQDFTGYTMIDFNNWKPTVNNPNNVTLRYGCVEGNVPTQGGVEVDATTGVIGMAAAYGHIHPISGTFHIYAVHETDETAYYDSIAYTLNVLPIALVGLTKNIDEGGSVSMPDATDVPTLTHHYTTLAGTPTAFVAQGQDLNVLAENATGYHFTGWTLSNEPLATTAAYTYHVPDAITGTSALVTDIKAVFDTNTYTLTVLSDDVIMGSANGSTTAKHFLSYEISATPNTDYHFTQWSDGNTQNPRTVTLTENTTYTAEFAVNSYAITTGVLPANSGSVTGAGTYNHFDNATLTATATTGYTFTNWTENGVVVNATNPYEFQVTGARELVANFSLNTYAVSASANPAAGGTVTGAGTYDHGTNVTVTATANDGYAFVNWTEGGQEVSTNASYSFTFTEGRTLVANFTPIIYTVTFNPGTGSCQTQSLTGSIESSIDIDAVTATPSTICGNQDWVFAGWSTASVGETSQAPTFVSGTEYVPTGNITLYAVYTKTEQGEGTWANATSIEVGDRLALVCSTANRELSGLSSGTSPIYGTIASYAGSPAGVYPLTVVQGYNDYYPYAFKTSDNTYLSWSSQNSLTTRSNIINESSWNVTFASGNATISNAKDNSRKLQYNSSSPRFACYSSTQTAVQLYKYTASSMTVYNSNPVCYVYAVNVDQNIPHGSVNASQTTDIVAGTEITLTPAMDDGYHFGRWFVTAGNDPVTVENNKFTMPASDVNVSAEFWIDTLTVNATANPAAGGTVTGAGDYEFGDLVTLTATANTGYTFVNWTQNNQEVSTSATYEFTFDGAAGTRTFVANFSLNSYEISVSANPTAGGNVNGGNTYNHGATAMLTANPSTGYHFVNWTKEGVVVSTDANYSFTVAEAGAYVANFALNSYTIAATANPTAGGAVSGAGTYNHFDNVTLTATVVNGYDFDGWYNGNDQVATSLEYSFVATGDVTLEARFAKRYTITFVPGSHSSSTIEPLQGSSVTAVNIDAVTADPSALCVDQDWEFAGWSSQVIAETNVAPTTWVSGTAYYPTSDITLYAVYTKTEGAGSNTASIDFSDQGYTNAQDVTDVAISNNVNVTFSKGTSNNAPKYYSNNVAIPAIRCYGGNTFTVTATEASITNITLTFGTGDGNNYISPDDGDYSNGTWTGNENSVVFTISGTSGNRRIAGMSVTTFSGTITYNSDPECFVYDVVVNPAIEHGTVTADPNTGVIAGTEITLTNTPSEGYHFAGWTVTAGNDPVTVENNKFLMPESDVNVTATFEPDTFTLTINYSIVGGGDAPQSYSDRLPFGTPYSVNTPVIAGLTPSQEVVSGTMPAQDVTVNVTYSTVPYTLTIHYVYADNTPAANDVVRNLAYNVPYSETSPTIEGYTPDQAEVSGTMGEADLEVTVVYSINSHNLTVNYVNEASAQVAESHTATLNYHDNYSVTSPQVAGYAANKSVVSGTMGDADKTETVTYYQVQTNIVDATNCAGTGTGSLTVTAPTGNFEYSLDGVTFQTETQFANLNAGDYTLYIRPTGEDFNYSGVWTVNSNITMPVAEASVNPFYCLGDEINLSGNGSSTGSEYTYAWSGPNNFTATDINATIAAAEDIHSGSYTLTVTNTVTNCVSDTTVDVIVNTPNMNGYLFTIATHGDAYANLVGGQATPVFATPTVQHYLADAGCTVTLSNDAQATYEEAGDYTITWTATDACGNTATTTQVLHIVLGTCPVAADVDGNTYPVVALNNICWMAANLRTTHYSDGRLIPNPMVYTSVMYPDATANLDMFGYLYDWTAAMDAANGLVQDANGNVQGICPDGWRMPKENEIRALVNDGVSDIFDLRTTDQWLNNFGTNTTGFSLLPAGCYNANSDRFENLHGDAYIWGVGASAPAQPRVFWADCKCYNWQILDTTTPMGYSVRCVRNN